MVREYGEKRCIICGAYGKDDYCVSCAERMAKAVLKAIIFNPSKFGIVLKGNDGSEIYDIEAHMGCDISMTFTLTEELCI